MVLSKRNKDGEFVQWTNSSSGSSNQPSASGNGTLEPTMDEPPMKRARRTAKSDDLPTLGVVQAPTKRAEKAPRASRAKRTQAHSSQFKTLPEPSSVVVLTPSAGPSEPAKPPPKRGRKKTAMMDAPSSQPSGSQSQPEEKRQAKFKPRPPQNILERLGRVKSQRMFMIDRTRHTAELREEFSVLGSTGNVYTVTIDHVPRCNCPDAAKGNHCKHILFVFFKVLQVRESSVAWYQRALLTSELEEVFRNAPLAPNSIAHPHVLAAHARATGKAAPETPAGEAGSRNKRTPTEDDDCPICYDGMHGVAESALVFCEECGNALHKECFGQWKRTAATSGKSLTCVWCRARWIEAPTAGSTSATFAGNGYLNLADVANVSPVRDTSSYYDGPRRGQRYNYGWR